MTQSVNIAKGQGLTQGLKAYLEKLKSEGKIGGDINISKSQWDATIHDLQGMNDARLQTKDSKGSIFTGGNGTNWSKNMVVQEGTVNFSETEFNTLLKDMGVKLKNTSEAKTEPVTNPIASVVPASITSVDSSSGTAPVVQKEAQNEVAPVEVNKAEQFDKWTTEVAQKAEKLEKADDFIFESKEYRKDLTENEGKNAFALYTDNLNAFSADYIKLCDKFGTNNDGKIDYDEYKAKENADYKKAHPETIDIPKERKSSKMAFKTMDLDGDGFIDKKEQATFFAFLERDPEDQKYDAKISQSRLIGVSAGLNKKSTAELFKTKMLEIRDIFFPKQ